MLSASKYPEYVVSASVSILWHLSADLDRCFQFSTTSMMGSWTHVSDIKSVAARLSITLGSDRDLKTSSNNVSVGSREPVRTPIPRAISLYANWRTLFTCCSCLCLFCSEV